MVTRGGELGELERYPSMGTKLWLRRMNKSIGLRYSMVTVVKDTVLNTGNLMNE